MSVEYRWALHHAHSDPAVRVVVLTGAGDAFCVGRRHDLLDEIADAGGAFEKERTALPPYPDGTPSELRHNHTAPLAISTPVIAAINGACAGAGFVLATYADVRWASDGRLRHGLCVTRVAGRVRDRLDAPPHHGERQRARAAL